MTMMIDFMREKTSNRDSSDDEDEDEDEEGLTELMVVDNWIEEGFLPCRRSARLLSLDLVSGLPR